MAPKADLTRLNRDVGFLYAPLRLVLLNFAQLDESFDRLKAAHRLQEFTHEAIPILLRIFGALMGPAWATPQIPASLQATHQQLQQDIQQAGGQHQLIPDWLLGNTPIGVELPELLTEANIIGIFRTSQSNYLVRLRHGYGALRLSHLLLNVIAPRLRSGDSNERIFQDKPQNKGKGKGKGKPGRGKGRANRSRSPQRLAPANAPPPGGP